MSETRLKTFSTYDFLCNLSVQLDDNIRKFFSDKKYKILNIKYDSPTKRCVTEYQMTAHVLYEVPDEMLELERKEKAEKRWEIINKYNKYYDENLKRMMRGELPIIDHSLEVEYNRCYGFF